jgi:hypothetical protein
VNLAAGPSDFVHSAHATDQEVGAQPTDIAPEGFHGTVGRDEKRQHVEPPDVFRGLEPCIVPGRVPHQRQGLRARPGMPIHDWPAVRIEGTLQPQQAMVSSRCADPLGAAHLHDAIAGDADRREPGHLQRLSRE